MSQSLQESRDITRRSASNLALAFILLPKARRDGMSVLYAFCREVDDVADDETVPVAERRAQLAAWRSDVRRAFSQEPPLMAVNRELQPVIRQYGLSFEHFDDLLNGVEMDLDIKRYATCEDLEVYCYRVASVVGLLSIRIFGCQHPACEQYAVYLGKALQFTNILRDVRTDAERGRIYLPGDEMTRFGVTAEEILAFRYSERFAALAASLAGRARRFYQMAREVLPPSERRSTVAAELMASVYWNLLLKLERRRFDVFGPTPTRLGKGRKLALIMSAWWRLTCGSNSSGYGD